MFSIITLITHSLGCSGIRSLIYAALLILNISISLHKIGCETFITLPGLPQLIVPTVIIFHEVGHFPPVGITERARKRYSQGNVQRCCNGKTLAANVLSVAVSQYSSEQCNSYQRRLSGELRGRAGV